MKLAFCFIVWLFAALAFGATQAQDCQQLIQSQSVQRVKDPASNAVTYWGVGSIDFTQADDTGIINLMVGKSVSGADTTYKVSIVKGSLSTPDDTKGVTLRFADGTAIRKPDQWVKAEGSGNLYSLSVEVELTKAEFSELGRKPLSEVILMRSMCEVPTGLSASILRLVPCVIDSW